MPPKPDNRSSIFIRAAASIFSQSNPPTSAQRKIAARLRAEREHQAEVEDLSRTEITETKESKVVKKDRASEKVTIRRRNKPLSTISEEPRMTAQQSDLFVGVLPEKTLRR